MFIKEWGVVVMSDAGALFERRKRVYKLLECLTEIEADADLLRARDGGGVRVVRGCGGWGL